MSAAHSSAKWECQVCDRCFVSDNTRTQHYINGPHPYCKPCDQVFQNNNNYTAHMHSLRHMDSAMKCPFCKGSFDAASSVVNHLECGNCSSGLNRQAVNDAIRRLDRNKLITRPMITMPARETISKEGSWNGRFYACYLCSRGFPNLQAVNDHLKSPFHEQRLYRCPKKSCGRTFNLLSGLVSHVEAESCGVMRFGHVQKQTKSGIENMVGRMIAG